MSLKDACHLENTHTYDTNLCSQRTHVMVGQHALGTLDWLGMVTIRIQRPRIRKLFTALKLCDPPLTCAAG